MVGKNFIVHVLKGGFSPGLVLLLASSWESRTEKWRFSPTWTVSVLV